LRRAARGWCAVALCCATALVVFGVMSVAAGASHLAH